MCPDVIGDCWSCQSLATNYYFDLIRVTARSQWTMTGNVVKLKEVESKENSMARKYLVFWIWTIWQRIDCDMIPHWVSPPWNNLLYGGIQLYLKFCTGEKWGVSICQPRKRTRRSIALISLSLLLRLKSGTPEIQVNTSLFIECSRINVP